MTISDRLTQAMEEAGFRSQSALSRASGVPQPTINRILNRSGARGPEAATLAALASACNVAFEWLHEGTGPMARRGADGADGADGASLARMQPVVVAEDGDPRFVKIKMVTLRLSAGISGFQADPEHDPGSTLPLDAGWLGRNHYVAERLVATRVKGESMEPTLYDGDIIVINTADNRPADGAVFAVNYEGEAVVKRLSRDAGDWWLESDNSDKRKYHRKVCRGSDCIIVGRVVRKESDRI
ncbi:helix-turn-helix domain-containing protein [Massilia violaceinigra]|uniref:Helix-turn-helix domain-containing protein n=1 Tax=Massilia violaceinigra TaxID=2045208 RepID=A0ABY4AAH6_9BURK|nr:LexA family transcriptional regulator [Massilia violaceinigra]UOD31693.1 helix-turn-helix domain-containing protein [Massilia violaceinigra]